MMFLTNVSRISRSITDIQYSSSGIRSIYRLIGILYKQFPVWMTLCLLFQSAMVNAANQVNVSGLLEAELGAGTDYDGNHNSNLTMATVLVNLDANIARHATTHLSLLYEENQTPLEIDEAFIHYHHKSFNGASLKLGQMYLPFGWFETMMISDPLTLEIGEIRESAVMLRYDHKVNAALYLFNGELLKSDTNNNNIDNIGFSLGYTHSLGKQIAVATGIAYINNIGETNNLNDSIISNIPTGAINKPINAYAAHITLTWAKLTFVSEVVHSTDAFLAGELDSVRQSKPHASNVELSLALNPKLSLGLSLQHSRDTLALGLPQRRLLLGGAYFLTPSMRIKTEFAADRDFDTVAGGTGNSSHTLTLQLASEF